MPNQKASRDVVDLVTRPITGGIDVDGDNSVNFQIDGTRIGLSIPGAAAFTTITMGGGIISNVGTPISGTDGVNKDYVDDGDATTLSAANAYTDAAAGGAFSPGMIMMWGGSAAPAGWLLCDGSDYDPVTYSQLFSEIGYTYGNVAGNFAVPNLTGRFAVGPGDSGTLGSVPLALGDQGGDAEHQLTTSEMPGHGHSISGGSGTVGSSCALQSFTGGDTTVTVGCSSLSLSAAGAGGDQPHPNMPPFVTVNFIIKV